MDNLVRLVISAFLVLLGLIFGGRAERRHYEKIREEEKELLWLPTRAESWPVSEGSSDAKLVTGSVVIANDRFKSAVASLKTIFGGRLMSYETLLDRARREAVIRMKKQASMWGAKEVVHLRVTSSLIDELGVEVLAIGTAVK
jgi:uncharacterized protein YbjQ (UPF0145 family)